MSQFLLEYKKRIQRINPDELIWVGQEFAAYFPRRADAKFATLLLETFLRALKDVISSRKGRLQFRRSEYLANGGFLLRHRIWVQLTATWGWEDTRPCVQRKKAAEATAISKAAKTATKKGTKTWATVQTGRGSDHSKRTVTGKTVGAEKQKTQNQKHALGAADATMQTPGNSLKVEEEPLPPGQYPAVYLTCVDHFQWDA